jgi:hypothetical protein
MSASVIPTVRTPRPVTAATAIVLLTAAFVLLIGLRVDSQASLYVDDVATLAAALMATAACLNAQRRHTGMRAFWWLLSAACGSWALGELTWAAYDLVLHVDVPIPSFADIGYLAGTPLAAAAFLCHPAVQVRRGRRAVSALDALAVATALLSVSWSLLLHPLVEASDQTLAAWVSLAYPFTDVVLLFLVVLALCRMPAGNRVITCFLLAGLVTMAIGDSAYAYLFQLNDYAAGSLLDAMWFAAYLTIAIGASFDANWTSQGERQASLSSLVSVTAPYVPILLGLGVVAALVTTGRQVDRVTIVLAAALAVLVLARQATYAWSGREHPTPEVPSPSSAAQAGARGSHADDAWRMQTGLSSIVQAETLARRRSAAMLASMMSLASLLAIYDLSLLVVGRVG